MRPRITCDLVTQRGGHATARQPKPPTPPLWLAASSEAGAITGTYAEKRKQQRPKVATDPGNQRHATELAKALVSQAPTATPPLKGQPHRGKTAD
jgi:hypothetical protein